MRKSLDMDIIATLTPVNSSAKNATSKGTSYELKEVDTLYSSKIKPNTKSFKGPKEYDLTGFKFGLFTVVGYMGRNSQNYSKWLVRCRCGTYEVRTAKSIKKRKKEIDACRRCLNLQYLRNKYKDIKQGE